MNVKSAMIKTASLPALVVSRFALVAFFFLLLVTCYLLLIPRPVHAQTPLPVPAECQVPDDATAQQMIDALNKCAIKKNVFDDKVFNLNQIAGTIDSLNTHLLGYSLLHPETDEVTAGRGAL